MQDVIIIGGGPAGISAALTLRARGKSVTIITRQADTSPLAKAERVDNYPGMPAVTGAEMLELMTQQAIGLGVQFVFEKALTAMPMGESIFVSAGQEVLEGKALILATGVSRGRALPGEAELLGAGVSYCATCDGMLYRGKTVAVLGFAQEAAHEAEFLRGIGCEVLFFDAKESRGAVITGSGRVEAIEVSGEKIPCAGVFVLRDTVAPAALLPGLELNGNHIEVQHGYMTNIPGVYAVGDCIGAPYQIAKAVGEGNVAALNAAAYLDKLQK